MFFLCSQSIWGPLIFVELSIRDYRFFFLLVFDCCMFYVLFFSRIYVVEILIRDMLRRCLSYLFGIWLLCWDIYSTYHFHVVEICIHDLNFILSTINVVLFSIDVCNACLLIGECLLLDFVILQIYRKVMQFYLLVNV